MAHGRLRQVVVALALGAGLGVVGVLLGTAAAGAATTASLSPAGRLTVTGTGAGDTIVVRAVNGSTIEVASLGFRRRFPAGVVRSIQVNGGGGNDTIRIADGPLAFTRTRPTTLDGGNGNDTLRGGKGSETLRGRAGSDTVTWSVGQGNDQVEGGTGSDTVRAVGRAVADTFALSKQTTRARIAVTGGGSTRSLGVEALVVQAGGGADTVTAGTLAGLGVNEVTLNAGGGTDVTTFNGTAAADALSVTGPAVGTRTVTGTVGLSPVSVLGSESLTVNGGGDADVLTAPPLAEPVSYDGGPGADTLIATGSTGADTWNVVGGSGDFRLLDLAAQRVAAVATESLVAAPDAGADDVTLEGLAATGLAGLEVELGVADAPDVSVDVVTVRGTTGADVVQAAAVSGAAQVTGLGPTVVVDHPSAANDTLALQLDQGGDTGSGNVGLAAIVRFTLDGGDGNDVLNGGNGADTILGGNGNDTVDGNGGNDTVFGGEGNDIAVWDPGDGSDVIEGQAGSDSLLFNGAPGAEIFAASSNGGRLLFTRNVGNIVMDLDDVEILSLNALGGIDTMTVNDLAATDVTRVDLNVGVNGVGDGSPDAITVNGTVGEESFQVVPFGVDIAVRQPDYDVTVARSELANDTLTINASGGADGIVSSTSASLNVLRYTFNGGDGNDTISGTPGNDTINGENNDDVLMGQAGDDTFTGGSGTDFAIGGAGADVNGGGIESFTQ
jgi:Ca2+-binding RTX toxin-like protein